MFTLQEDAFYHKKYDVEKQLGKGAFGVVYQIKEKDNGYSYAAKHMKVRKREQRDQILQEINILQSINHRKIMTFKEAYEKKGVREEIILVTEYLNGGELFERIVSDDFNLTESDCAEFMKQILEAVEYLHENSIVHLDLKPENIVCVNPDSLDIKIIDFGLARKLEHGEEVRMMCGTPEYVAPEIVSYDCISTATDMWSIGVLCYILISGFSPFEGDNEAETYVNISYGDYDFDCEEFDNISDNAKDFIEGLLKKKQAERMSVGQCRGHDWLIQRNNRSTAVINKDNLKKFLNKRRWKRIINVRFALKTMVSKGSLEGDQMIKKEMKSRDNGCEFNPRSEDKDVIDSKCVTKFPEEKNEEELENDAEIDNEGKVETSAFSKSMPVCFKTYFQIDLNIVSGKNLVKMDHGSLSDPYVKLVFKNKTIKKTKVRKNTLEPKWNEKFKLFIEKEQNNKNTLLFQVYDKDLIGKELMGLAEIDLDSYDLQKPYEINLILETGGIGKLRKFKTLGSIQVVMSLLLIELYYQP